MCFKKMSNRIAEGYGLFCFVTLMLTVTVRVTVTEQEVRRAPTDVYKLSQTRTRTNEEWSEARRRSPDRSVKLSSNPNRETRNARRVTIFFT